MKVILAGKHELACALFEILNKLEFIQVEYITCKSEDLNKRPSLALLLNKNKKKPLNRDFSHQALLECIEGFKPDLFITAGFDKIIKEEVLQKLNFGVNIHFGLLPKYRGAFSIPNAIINDEKYIGVTLHELDQGIDTGRVITQTKISNDQKTSCKDLYLECVKVATKLAKKLIKRFIAGEKIISKAQNDKISSYFPLKMPSQGIIDWNQNNKQLINFIRACHFPPFPPATTYIDEIKIGINFPVEALCIKHKKRVGQIIKHKKTFGLSTNNGFIFPNSILVNSELLEFTKFVKMNPHLIS